MPGGGEGQKNKGLGGGIGGPAWHLAGAPGGTEQVQTGSGQDAG